MMVVVALMAVALHLLRTYGQIHRGVNRNFRPTPHSRACQAIWLQQVLSFGPHLAGWDY
jgi:hypothetical protein